MSDLFNGTPPEIDPNKDYLSELVGEGRKFKDEKALALGKVHADRLVDELKRKLAETEQELQTRNRLEELLTAATKRQEAPPSPDHGTPPQLGNEPVNDLTPEKIESLISSRLSEHQKALNANQNLNTVKTELVKKFGNGYEAELVKVAEAAGVSPEWLNETAKSNPRLVLNLVEANAPKKEAYLTPPANGLNPALAQSNDERTLSFYKKLKAKDPKYYESKEVQSQMHNDAMRLRDRFFDIQF